MSIDLANEWERVRPSILPALPYLRGSHDETDLINGVLGGHYKMLTKGKSFVLAQAERYKNHTRVNIFLGGGNLFEGMALIDDAEAWAREIGAKEIRTTVRPEIDKINQRFNLASPGWERKAVVYVKELTDG